MNKLEITAWLKEEPIWVNFCLTQIDHQYLSLWLKKDWTKLLEGWSNFVSE